MTDPTGDKIQPSEELFQDIIMLERFLKYNWPLAHWLHENSEITSHSGLKFLLNLKEELDGSIGIDDTSTG